MMAQLTAAQRTVLITLLDVATHEGGWIILKNQYHSAAAALIRKGYAEKQDNGFFRPRYKITEAGVKVAQVIDS